MANINETFPSKYLTAADLPEEGITVTITDVSVEKMKDGSAKFLILTRELEKGFVCNKTNAAAIAKLYGDESDDWERQRITIFPTYTDFGGEQVECIRVKPRKPKPVEATPAATLKPAPNGNGNPKVVRHPKPAEVKDAVRSREPGDDDFDEFEDNG